MTAWTARSRGRRAGSHCAHGAGVPEAARAHAAAQRAWKESERQLEVATRTEEDARSLKDGMHTGLRALLAQTRKELVRLREVNPEGHKGQ